MRKALVALAAAGAAVMLPAVPAAASGGGGCGQPTTEAAGDAVSISKFCFEPTILFAEPGQEITFTNRDPLRHNVLGANATWGSFETLGEDRSAVYRFSEPGVYPYVCAWHPGMVGAVVVGGAGKPGIADPAAVSRVIPEARPEPLAEPGAEATSRSSGSSTWKAMAVAAAGLLILVVVGTAGLRRRLGS